MLRVVDEQIDAVAQLENVVRHEVVGVVRAAAGPVVGDVRDGATVPLDAEPEGETNVPDEPRPHLGQPDREVVVAGVMEAHIRAEAVGTDRKEGRAHELREHVAQEPFGLTRAVDVERRRRVVHGREERQTLDVVPVQVREQHVRVELTRSELVSVCGQPGTEIEDDRRLPVRLDGHARRVPAITRVLRTLTRRRASNAVEPHTNPPWHGA